MRKFLTLSLALALPCAAVVAQKDQGLDLAKYNEEAAAMQKDVWGWDKPEFNVRAMPAQYSNASKIIVARHFEVSTEGNGLTRYRMFSNSVERKETITYILREAVKINDKSALADYSEFSYTQLEKGSYWFTLNGYVKIFLGIHVIKPDGSVKAVNASDVVLTGDKKWKKEAKVAVPDLQVGDIIDYFVATQKIFNVNSVNPYEPFTFQFYDDAPVMSYSIHFDLSKKYVVCYQTYNNPPDFKRSKGADDANELDIKGKDMLYLTGGSLWVAPYRQLPIMRMYIVFGMSGYWGKLFKSKPPGTIIKNPPSEEFLNDLMDVLADEKAKLYTISYSFPDEIRKNLTKLHKDSKNISEDSLITSLYYLFRYYFDLDVDRKMDIEETIDRVHSGQNARYSGRYICSFLTREHVDNKLVIVARNNKTLLKEAWGQDDLDFMTQAGINKKIIIGTKDIFTYPYYIPEQAENTSEACVVDVKLRLGGSNFGRDRQPFKLPGSNSSDNARIEKLAVTVVPDGSGVNLERSTRLKGHYKSDVQKQLILFEDYCNAERRAFGAETTIIEELQEDKSSRKYADELKTAFDKARAKQKDNFLDEAQKWFDQPISDVSDYKITNMGVRHYSPDFIYTSKFKMGAIVKKAGNNLVLEVGKLQGAPLNISGDQRKRTLDVRMPFARSLNTDITVYVPDGYTAEGVEALNKKVENETGYFMVEASSDGKVVTIHVKKSYNHATEPVGNWEKMLQFIDAANEWTNAKILLKKK